jgi:hypothetical protein
MVTLVTESAMLAIGPGLRPGPHRFRLVVETADGRRSRPAEVTVTVLSRPSIWRRLVAWLRALLRRRRWR